MNTGLTHQDNQQLVIQELERQVAQNSLSFSTVSNPDTTFEEDDRMCLTTVHFPSEKLKQHIATDIIDPLRDIDTSHYYYDDESLHFTIKNIRTIDKSPQFTEDDIKKAQNVLATVLLRHTAFRVYYYRLLLFPNNLALVGTTDQSFDDLVLELDQELKNAGVPDNKVYVNDKYFFSNITLARFKEPVSESFKEKVKEISSALSFAAYTVDSVTLLTANAVMKKRRIIEKFSLTSS